jgi:hypothetical protein
MTPSRLHEAPNQEGVQGRFRSRGMVPGDRAGLIGAFLQTRAPMETSGISRTQMRGRRRTMILVLLFELRRDSLRRVAKMACPAVAQEHKVVIALLSEGWWTRSQRIRTEGKMAFEAALTELSKVPVYQAIAEQAAHLHLLGMNPNRIAVHLCVDRTTVTRALRWVRSHYIGM